MLTTPPLSDTRTLMLADTFAPMFAPVTNTETDCAIVKVMFARVCEGTGAESNASTMKVTAVARARKLSASVSLPSSPIFTPAGAPTKR